MTERQTIETVFKIESGAAVTFPLAVMSAPVRLREDPHLTSKAMFIIANEMTGLTEENWLDVSDEIRANSMRAATRVFRPEGAAPLQGQDAAAHRRRRHAACHVQRLHHAEPRELDRPAVVGGLDEDVDRVLPTLRVLLICREACDVGRGVP